MEINLVSVVVPNYNHEPFLKCRLESIFSQTYANFEVILLDDASNDKSVKILESYANHSKVSHFVVNDFNSGSPFAQWEKGIKLAKGDYVWIAESDDFCESNFLETMIGMLKPSVSIAYCCSSVVDNQGKFLKINDWASELNKTKWNDSYINSGLSELKDYLKYRNTIPNASSVLFKRSDILKISFPTDYFYCGDWLIWCELAKMGDIAYSNQCLNHFRKHQLTTRFTKNIDKERIRFNEYFKLITSYNTFFERIFNMNKFRWIVDEWLEKSKHFGFFKALSLSMPLEIYLYFLSKLFLYKLHKKIR